MNSQTLLITGGSKGLGKKIAELFYSKGYTVVVAAPTKGDFDFESKGCYFIETNVQYPSALFDAVRKTIELTGRLDVLINNAGFSAWCPLKDISVEFWDNMINTNLKSVLFATQAAANVMVRGGVIINISSLAGKRGSANNSVYCASKFGVNGITQSLAKELGSKGIRVNAVCPVYIRTQGLEDALNKDSSPSNGVDLDAFLNEFARTQTALGVLPTDEQVANSCLFLSSEKAGAITGQCINVDCGVMPQ